MPASCPGFVEFVERGETRSDQVAVLAERLLAPVRDAGVDALLLGCTHYPFLARTIADVMGRDVVLVSSADETAFEVRAILGERQSATRGGVAGARTSPARCGCSRRATWGGSGPWAAGSSARSSARCGAVVARPPPVRRAGVAGDGSCRDGVRCRAPARRRLGLSVLTLTVLGCDGSHPAAGGAASGYLVRSWDSGTSVWMDAGPGTFANLQRFTDPLELSAIVLTHEHHDHFSDIEGFITAARWVYGLRARPVPVYAAPGVLGHLTQDVEGILDWHEVGDGDGVGRR